MLGTTRSTHITEVSFPDVQLTGSDTHSSPTSNTGIQNAWGHTSTPTHAFIERRLMQLNFAVLLAHTRS